MAISETPHLMYFAMRLLFTELSKSQTVEQIEAPVPFNIDADKMKKSTDQREGVVN